MKVRIVPMKLSGTVATLAAPVIALLAGFLPSAPAAAQSFPGGGALTAGAPPWLCAALGAGFAAATLTAGFFALRLKRARSAARTREADLAEANWRLDFALRAAGLGYWECDLETGAVHFDARKRAMLGIGDDEALSEASWFSRVHPEDRVRVREEMRRAVGTDGGVTLECRVLAPGGETRWFEDSASVYTGADGKRRFIGLVRDVTERHAAAEELREGQRRAQATADEKARFLAVMSHEIRTPMTGILGMIELLIDDPGSEKRAERLAIARRSAGTLLAILNDVLAFSRLESGQFALNPEPLRPRRLVSEVMDLMAPKARCKGLPLRWSIAPDVPEWVLADPVRARQVLVNLVSNAIKFTDTGEVAARIDLVAGAMALRFEVRDTGVGMSAEFLERAFESFVRDETGGAQREGTGLGLAISKHLAQLMGGSIEMTSTPGVGTLARFDIPVAPVRETPSDVAERPAESLAPMRILVAEDNSTNQYLVRALLEREGHRVTTVSDGAAAVKAATRDDFDVILMDVQMPVMDGAAATRAIRASGPPRADVPIIALTANALANDRQSYLADGMSDYVSKPIELAALNQALARVAGRRPPPVARAV